MINGKFASPFDKGWSLAAFCDQNNLTYSPDAKAEFIWVDTETTGLNDKKDQRDHILELGCIATTTDLHVVDVFHSFAWGSGWSPAIKKMPAHLHHMHNNSNLLAELMSIAEDPDQADNLTQGHICNSFSLWAADNGFQLSSTPMFGNTVSFDRYMLQQDLPTVLLWFHYRNVDVSSLKMLIKKWNRRAYEDWELLQPPSTTKDHRALLDLAWSIRELDFYRTRFLRVEMEKPDEQRMLPGSLPL